MGDSKVAAFRWRKEKAPQEHSVKTLGRLVQSPEEVRRQRRPGQLRKVRFEGTKKIT